LNSLLFIRAIRAIRGQKLVPKMLDLANARREDFATCLEQDFEIVFPDGTIPAKLIEANQWGPDQPANIRQPFSLAFRIDRNLRLPQGIYRMRNSSLGDMEIFLVQIAGDAHSSTLEAVFN
jgi:hypothetical protein